MRKAIVIGGGFGGLSAAIQLAAKGWSVTLIEAQAQLGGKLQRVVDNGYVFDRGASTITMPWVFEQVYRNCGVDPKDYISFYRVDPGAKNTFADGHVVDLSSDLAVMEQQIAVYSPEDAKQLRPFLRHAEKLYQISDEQFLNRMLHRWKDKLNVNLLKAMVAIRPFQPVDDLLSRYFTHPNTHQLFGRYATYVGSSPYHTPAVFTMMAHLEQQLGVWGVEGGTYALVRGFEKLARERGVEIVTSTRVEEIIIERGRATGVKIRALSQTCGLHHSPTTEIINADVIVANADALTVYRQLIGEEHRPAVSNRKIASYEPSLSGFVLLLGVKRKFEQLKHHNVWFPENYAQEFEDIFQRKIAPTDPTIYICWNGYSESNTAPVNSSNLFVLVNAPYNNPNWNWQAEASDYRDKIIAILERKLGAFAADIEVEHRYHPGMLEADTGAHRGAIYGISSNRFSQAFFRPANQSPDIKNLWFAGGSTHPGGGTPIVTLSGTLIANEIDKLS